MFFITNRFPKGSIRTRINRPFEFDLANNAPSNSMFFASAKRMATVLKSVAQILCFSLNQLITARCLFISTVFLIYLKMFLLPQRSCSDFVICAMHTNYWLCLLFDHVMMIWVL